MSTMELEGLRTDAAPTVKQYLASLRRWALSLASLLVASCGHFDIENRERGDAGGGGVDGDRGVDANDPLCYGANLVGRQCFSQALTGSLDVNAPVSIITSMVGDNNCSEIRKQDNGPSLCILAYRTITIHGPNTLRASGPNPLVLIAAESISISGSVDVSSQAGGDPTALGARAAPDCSSVNTDGPSGRPDPDPKADPYGGGGGAGGSLGSLGGAGGMSGLGAVAGGQPAPVTAPQVLVGGCAGGRGGEGVPKATATASNGGLGGAGGGAVYLLAGASLTISGQVNASGTGGIGSVGDIDGHDSGGGGGGGGSGGMIGLEAPSITVTGAVFANGGGGGGGSGSLDDSGKPFPGLGGSGSTEPFVAALGGAGGMNGGAGGNGSTGAAAGMPGANNQTYVEPGGGGGGGGGGVIRVFGTAPGSLGGMISPPAR